MNLRILIVSVVLLAAASVAVFVANRPAPPPSADPRIGQSLTTGANLDSAAKLRVSDQGKTVELAKNADNTWRVVSYYDLPADFSKISRFVGDLNDAKLQRLVTTSAERIARLEFKDTKIEFLGAGDKPLWSVTLGKTPDTGGGRFVKFDGEQKAFLATFAAWLDTEAKNWASADLVNLKADDIAKIEVSFADGAVALTRTKKDAEWTSDKTPAGQRLNAAKISSLLGSVGTLRFSETNDLTDEKVAAAKPFARTLKLTTFDGKATTVTLARKPEEKKLKAPVATADGKTGPAALGSLADLAKKDAEPAPAADATKPADSKPAQPEFETIPAGPVFVTATSSDDKAPINALMQKRAFQIYDYTYTALPQKADELFEPAPAAAPAPTAPKAEEPKKG